MRLNDVEAVKCATCAFYRERKSYSMSLNILAQALYTLFITEGVLFLPFAWTLQKCLTLADKHLEIMQRGFIRYIQQQGPSAEVPAGLMGGVYHSPLLLFYHFSAIALYSIWLLLYESPFCHLPLNLIKGVVVFVKALMLIWPFIMAELQT